MQIFTKAHLLSSIVLSRGRRRFVALLAVGLLVVGGLVLRAQRLSNGAASQSDVEAPGAFPAGKQQTTGSLKRRTSPERFSGHGKRNQSAPQLASAGSDTTEEPQLTSGLRPGQPQRRWRPGANSIEEAKPSAFEPLTGQSSLSGLVLDANGGPIAGATLSVSPSNASMQLLPGRGVPPMGPRALATTNTEGWFRFNVPSGPMNIEASAEAYASVSKRVVAPADGLTLILVPSSSIVGRVIDSDGSPVAGADVILRQQGIFGPDSFGKTNTTGNFRVTGLTAGRWAVEAQAAGLRGEQQWVNLAVAETSLPIELTLESTHTLSGTVRLAGKLCLQAFVQVGGFLGPGASADENGHYQVDGIVSGKHSVQARCGQAQPQRQLLTWGQEAVEHLEIDWDLTAGLSLRGLVVHANGEPADAISVFVEPAPEASSTEPEIALGRPGALVSFCDSDAEGAFECTGLEPGWYRARVSSPRSSSVVSPRVQVGADPQPTVQLMLPEMAEIHVKVRASEGEQRSVTRVIARGASGFPLMAKQREGGFILENLQLGTYSVSQSLGATKGSSNSVEVTLTEAGQVVEIELAPVPLAIIVGRVLDAQRQPVQDARVQALQGGDALPFSVPEGAPALSDADGWFELPELPVGQYTLRASHSLGEAHQANVQTGQSEVLLMLADHGEIAGWVFGFDGKPEPIFSVFLAAEQSGPPTVVHGKNGRWSVPWAAAGTYAVAVSNDRGGAIGQVAVVSNELAEVRMTLEPTLAKGVAMQRLWRPESAKE